MTVMSDCDPKNWKKSGRHPSDDDLLCFIDGEVSATFAEDIRSHLEACWKCRNRSEKFQSAISLFIDYRSQVLQPMVEVPNNWKGFGSNLQDVVSQTGPPTLWQKWRGTLTRFRTNLNSIDLRTSRLAAISAFTLLFFTVGLYFVLMFSQTVVSAEELLERAATRRQNEIATAGEPVVYQQLQIRRRDSLGEKAASVELWHDIDNARMRQVALTATDSEHHPTITNDFALMMRANDYEPPPLSIIGYRTWRNSLADKRESVVEDRLEDGVPILRLDTEVGAEVADGKIIASSLTVRSRDYHAVAQKFRIKTPDGEVEFELRETSFAVMSLGSLKADFFGDATPIIAAAKPSASVGRSPDAESVPEVVATGGSSSANTATAAAATAELEVEVLNLLHGAGADLGEQIEVKRMANGPLHITGVVETTERKNQILSALQSVAANPALRIQINTAAEEIARQKQSKAQPRPSIETVEVEGGMFPAEADVRAAIGDNDQAVRQFASRMTSRSASAMSYLWAMKRLQGQFSPGELAKLSPDARAKWLNVIRSHARSYQREIAALKRELQPVFGGSSGGGEGTNIDGDADLMRAIGRLFDVGSSGNQVVRQAFTTTSSQAATNALKTAQFWQMLNRAEALSASIARGR
jgi:hypothetical protein